MDSSEFIERLLSGIIQKKTDSTELPNGYRGTNGPIFLRELADYIERASIKFCECGECPDANRGNVIDGLRKTAIELEMLRDSYQELSEMYEELSEQKESEE